MTNPGPPGRRMRAPHPPPRGSSPSGAATAHRRRAELSDAAVVWTVLGDGVGHSGQPADRFRPDRAARHDPGRGAVQRVPVANQLPNMIAALVLEATFTAIFVPVLARAERDDPDGGTAFVRRLVTLATTLLLVATAFRSLAAPLLVELMLGADPLVNRALTTAFAYLLLPQIIFYGLSSVFMAILNTRNMFGPPAWAPVVQQRRRDPDPRAVCPCTRRTFARSGRDGQRQTAGAGRRHHPRRGRPSRGAVRRDPGANVSACARCGVSTIVSRSSARWRRRWCSTS